MGDPKKQKKQYRRPLMIWDEERIARDKELIEEYGLKNKKEIWKVESHLASLHNQAKKLIASSSEQSKKETELLLTKLISLKLLQSSSKLEDVLSLTEKDLLNRRLQTIVLKKSLAKSPKQSRQFITHNHIALAGQVMNVPSYLVGIEDEQKIDFTPNSNISNDMHPERSQPEKQNKEIIPKDTKTPVPDTKENQPLSTSKEKKEQEKTLENSTPIEPEAPKEK